jgi:hypothetical protein
MDRAKRDVSILEHIVGYCKEIPEIHKDFGDSSAKLCVKR